MTWKTPRDLCCANIDAFAHSIRDQDIDDEMVAMFKQRPNFVLNPNLPGRGRKGRYLVGCRRACRPPSSKQSRRPNRGQSEAQCIPQHPGPAIWKPNAAGVFIVMGTDGDRPAGPHEEMEDMVLAGMTPTQVIPASTQQQRAVPAARRHGHAGGGKERRPAGARRQSGWRTSPTRGGSRWWCCAANRWTVQKRPDHHIDVNDAGGPAECWPALSFRDCQLRFLRQCSQVLETR